MHLLKTAFVALALLPSASSSASAAGALAVCTGPEGLSVEVDLLKGTMRISSNELTSGLANIIKQGLTRDKRVMLAAGSPENPVVLVLNDTVGSVSTLMFGERRVEVVCR